MGFFLLKTKQHTDTRLHTSKTYDKVANRSFLRDVNVERWKKYFLLYTSLYWRLLWAPCSIITDTHTHTWQEATSWLVGWLTLVCLWLRMLPSWWDCCSLLLTLIVWNNPAARVQAHLSASYSQTSLTINSYICVCMCVHTWVFVCVSVCVWPCPCVWVCISVPLTS